jgi:1-acyl-sn-glycerol-3-phosphate acyltransferase
MGLMYHIVKLPARASFLLFFRKIYISGMENIPKDGPVIFAANHPTMFLDPIVLGAFLPRPLWFMTRGDVFENPIIRSFFFSLQMIPVFRFRNGYSNLKKNAATMDWTKRLLQEGRCILIFSEGACIHGKRLRPLVRGTAKMAINAYSEFGNSDSENEGLSSLYIVPIGINHEYAVTRRESVMIKISEPILVHNWLKGKNLDDPGLSLELTKLIQEKLSENVIHIEEPKLETQAEPFLEEARKKVEKTVFPIFSKSKERFDEEFKAAKLFNKNHAGNLQDVRGSSLNLFWKLLLMIPALVGYVFLFIPMFLGASIFKLNKRPLEERASFRWAYLAGFSLIELLILGFLIVMLLGWPWFLVFSILFPFSILCFGILRDNIKGF